MLLRIILNRLKPEGEMTDALEDQVGTVSIGGRKITNLRFCDAIDVLAGTKTELKSLVNNLYKASGASGMEIRAEKTKLMANNIAEGPLTDTKVQDQKLSQELPRKHRLLLN